MVGSWFCDITEFHKMQKSPCFAAKLDRVRRNPRLLHSNEKWIGNKNFHPNWKKKVAGNAFFCCCSNHFCISLIFKSDEVSQTRCKTGFSLASNLYFCKSRFVLCVFCASKFWILNWQLHSLFENKDGLMVNIDSRSSSVLSSNLATCSEKTFTEWLTKT